MKISIVTTTINVPHLLQNYAADSVAHGYKDCDIIVTGDNKTHADAKGFCASVEDKTGMSIRYYDVKAQNVYMKDYPELDNFLPWNCIQRRNVAILMAYEQGSDMIVTIDDDNFLAQQDYLGGHGQLGVPREVTAIASDTGWLNICKFLEDAQGRKFYARGHPVEQRLVETANDRETQKRGKVVANGGFWLGDPDIDAVTRLAAPIDVTRYTREGHFALDIGTWAPFNSQNTALHRSAIPGYFLCSGIGRFDDIWASFMVKRIADHLGDFITFGLPLVKQDRNPHDLWVDADHERFGMQLSDVLCNWLRAVPLSGRNYHECARELAVGLKHALDNSKLAYAHRAFINHFIDGYRVWGKTMERIGAHASAEKHMAKAV